MRLCVWSCVISLSVWVGASRGEEPQPTVEQLIERLGSSDFPTREAASRGLSKLSAAALPILRKAQDHPDAEIRRRLEELIPELEGRVALEPRRVTLKASNRPLKEILAEL